MTLFIEIIDALERNFVSFVFLIKTKENEKNNKIALLFSFFANI